MFGRTRSRYRIFIQDKTRQDKTRQDKTRQDKTRLLPHSMNKTCSTCFSDEDDDDIFNPVVVDIETRRCVVVVVGVVTRKADDDERKHKKRITRRSVIFRQEIIRRAFCPIFWRGLFFHRRWTSMDFSSTARSVPLVRLCRHDGRHNQFHSNPFHQHQK